MNIVNQNIEVCVEATDKHTYRTQEVTYDNTFYSSVLQDICILDYHTRKILMFKCDCVFKKK